jgi:hypothetical protein
MRRIVKAFAIALLLLPGLALAQTQKYLPEASVAAAQARSAAECYGQGCDGVHTLYWWQTLALQDGAAALQIPGDGVYSAIGLHRTGKGIAGLSPAEQLALVPYATECGNKLLAWCIATSAFGARFTTAQIAELDAAAAPCGADWAAIKANAVTDLQVAGQPLASACAAQGLQFDWRTILAPMPVAEVPQ